jgi:hypothetical protein
VQGARQPGERTGLRLLVGAGRGLHIVNFDSGHTTTMWSGEPGRPEFVQTVTPALPAYGTTAGCRISEGRLLRIDPNGVEDLGPLRPDQSVLADATQAWVATTPNGRRHSPTVLPIGGGPLVTLPKQTFPAEIENGTIVASTPADAHGGSVVLLDATTGRVERRLPHADYPMAARAGVVLWTSGCDLTNDKPCVLDVLHLAGDLVTHVPLPRPAIAGTISPDGSRAALLLEGTPNALSTGHPFPPSNIAVLNLHTGRLQFVPGITVAPKESPGLAFSADGRWLAIALDAGTETRLLAWRPGLGPPYEGVSVRGRNYGTPPLIVLGGG